jgi:hypothetical protein
MVVIVCDTEAHTVALAAKLQSESIPFERYTPKFIDIESHSWPPEMSLSEVAEYVAQFNIPGLQVVGRVGAVMLDYGTIKFVVPEEHHTRVLSIPHPDGYTLKWLWRKPNPHRACNNCWRTGHSKSACTQPRRCFRCAGNCPPGKNNCTADHCRVASVAGNMLLLTARITTWGCVCRSCLPAPMLSRLLELPLMLLVL